MNCISKTLNTQHLHLSVPGMELKCAPKWQLEQRG
jgi:hypothetical protein